jgi:hypothetical protein
MSNFAERGMIDTLSRSPARPLIPAPAFSGLASSSRIE